MLNNLKLYVVAVVYKSGNYYFLKFFVPNERIQSKALKAVKDYIEPTSLIVEMIPYGRLDVSMSSEKLLSFLRIEKRFDSFVFEQNMCCELEDKEVLLKKINSYRKRWELVLSKPL